MARRGRPPKPTHLRALQGNPGNRPLNKNEPKPTKGTPRCPAWMSPGAKKAWKHIVPDLQRIGVLTVIDGAALAGLCHAYARWREAEEFLEAHGPCYPVKDEGGNLRCMMQFPQVAIARSLLKILQSGA